MHDLKKKSKFVTNQHPVYFFNMVILSVKIHADIYEKTTSHNINI